jgi:protein subunit release factor A
VESVIIEIRGAEGGEDARLLVLEQCKVYLKYAARRGFKVELLDERPGIRKIP